VVGKLIHLKKTSVMFPFKAVVFAIVMLIFYAFNLAHISAQNPEYELGYVVTEEDDTLRGLLKVESQFESQKQVTIYFADYTKQVYLADSLKMYQRGARQFHRFDYQSDSAKEPMPLLLLLTDQINHTLEYQPEEDERKWIYFESLKVGWKVISGKEAERISTEKFPEKDRALDGFQKGYVVVRNGDTLNCFVSVKDSWLNLNKLELRDEAGEKIKLKEDEIDSYKCGKRRYVRGANMYGFGRLQEFVRFCSAGKVDLYRYDISEAYSGMTMMGGNHMIYNGGMEPSFDFFDFFDIPSKTEFTFVIEGEIKKIRAAKFAKKPHKLFPKDSDLVRAFKNNFTSKDIEAAIEIYNGRLDD